MDHFVMERMGRLEDLDRSFDVAYWQRQGSNAIFAAAGYRESLERNLPEATPDVKRLKGARRKHNG